MTALDYILDGLEAELALERELGVRLVECDRALLRTAGETTPRGEGAAGTVMPVAHVVGQSVPAAPSPRGSVTVTALEPAPPLASSSRQPTTNNQQPATDNQQPATSVHPFVFLHDKPLSPAGVEMMAKIITAMGTTAEQAPIVFEKPIPRAKVYVVLGGLALRKFQPTLKGAPGMWLETAKGAPVLITYSPEYILRFKEITPAVKKIKQDMWQSLKSVLQRVRC